MSSTQKWRFGAGDISRVSQITGQKILENCDGWQPNKGDKVQSKCRSWHPKLWVSVLENIQGRQPNIASVCRKSFEVGTQKWVHVSSRFQGSSEKWCQ
jgi:hypothetical protein